jgi:gliding motility-associated-like protein
VIPYPIPGLSADEYEANIFEPMITFIDSSKLATGCQLRLGDGTLVNTCDYTHSFNDTGYFNVTQIVRNEFNCIDSTTIRVYISPAIRIFIPDAFSPNDDNLNDIFKPTLIGVKHYHFSVFNRWGEEIFKTENTDVGWDGMYYNSKAPVGVYVYVIRYTDVKGTEKSFNGKVVLVR